MLISLAFFAAAVSLLTVSNAWADGFSGRVGGGVLLISQADNLSGRGQEVLVSRHEKPRSSSIVFPIGLFEVRYAWDDNQVSLGTPLDEPAGLALGYRRKLEQGALTGSMQYSFWGREWQDPYLVGVPRSDTRVHTYGGRVSLEDIGGSPLTLAVKGTVKAVVDEALTGDLRRDGALLDVDMSWRQSLLAGWVLTPTIGYQRGEYLGAVNSFHGGNVGVGAMWRGKDLLFVSRLTGTLAFYDREHPLFNARRHELGGRFNTMLTWSNPFSWQQVFISTGAAIAWSDANIDFFDRQAAFFYATLGYQF
jgi:hypothetical protein